MLICLPNECSYSLKTSVFKGYTFFLEERNIKIINVLVSYDELQ